MEGDMTFENFPDLEEASGTIKIVKEKKEAKSPYEKLVEDLSIELTKNYNITREYADYVTNLYDPMLQRNPNYNAKFLAFATSIILQIEEFNGDDFTPSNPSWESWKEYITPEIFNGLFNSPYYYNLPQVNKKESQQLTMAKNKVVIFNYMKIIINYMIDNAPEEEVVEGGEGGEDEEGGEEEQV